MAMDQCLDILKSSFRLINEDICSYIQSVLETSGEDFESPDDLFEAVGEVLQEMDGEKSESEIQKICEVLYRIVKPGLDQATVGTGKLKLLETSVQLGQLAAEQHNGAEVGNSADSIWLKTGEEELRNQSRDALEVSREPSVSLAGKTRDGSLSRALLHWLGPKQSQFCKSHKSQSGKNFANPLDFRHLQGFHSCFCDFLFADFGLHIQDINYDRRSELARR